MKLGTARTLLDFGEQFDWRVVEFAEPIPDSGTCSACSVCAKDLSTLPCGHVLCKPCFDGAQVHGRACPLDNVAYYEKDITWTQTENDILRTTVHCWNRASGCRTVTELSNLPRHFRDHCTFHTAPCSKCGARVLRAGIVEHLCSGCISGILSSSATSELARQTMEPTNDSALPHIAADCGGRQISTEVLKAMNDMMQRQEQLLAVDLPAVMNDQNEMKAKVIHMMVENRKMLIEMKQRKYSRTLKTLLSLLAIAILFTPFYIYLGGMEKNVESLYAEKSSIPVNSTFQALLHHRVNNVIGPVKKITLLLAAQCKTSTPEIIVELESFVKERQPDCRWMTGALSSLPLSIATSFSAHQWNLTGYSKAKRDADSNYESALIFSSTYLQGYYIEPTVKFNKTEGGIKIFVAITILRGIHDRYLQWPFKKHLTFTVKHPTNTKEITKSQLVPYLPLCFDIPTKSKNKRVEYPDTAIVVRELEKGGFVVNDGLILRLELN